jgi:hypothetical protein
MVVLVPDVEEQQGWRLASVGPMSDAEETALDNDP